MRDFVKTKSMVERWNFLVTCLGNPYANEDELNETADEMFRLSAKLPIAAQKEFVDVADKADLQWWFGVWVRILCKLDKLPKMGCHAVKTYELALFQELGKTIKETAQDYNLAMPMLPEQFLSPWEAIEAAGGTVTDEAVQLATDGEKEREREREKPKRTFRDYMSGEDADERWEKAKQVKGHGRDALREILRITFPEKLTDYPSYPMFKQCFGDIIGKSDYYCVLKE